MRLRHALAAALIGTAAVGACSSHAPGNVATHAHIDRRLRQLAETHPDSVVGVLIRTAAPPDSTSRAAMVAAGLAVGTVAGDVLTGRLRAADALKVARLPFVVHIELSRKIPITRHPS